VGHNDGEPREEWVLPRSVIEKPDEEGKKQKPPEERKSFSNTRLNEPKKEGFESDKKVDKKLGELKVQKIGATS
jgi:hypothetical protein